ncbi:MAG: hypothetical protein GY940_24360 [bacterium]|nr:hypothetical protein [bacterium]
MTHTTQSTQSTRSRGEFYADNLKLQNRRTIFTLSSSKEGCNQIVFEYNEDAELKQVIMGFFQSGKAFDFHISRKLGGGQCKIDTIERGYSGRGG